MQLFLVIIMVLSGLGAARITEFIEEEGDGFSRAYKVLINTFLFTYGLSAILYLFYYAFDFSLMNLIPSIFLYLSVGWLAIETWTAKKRGKTAQDTLHGMYLPYRLLFIISMMFSVYWLASKLLMTL